ncbi:MAG: hypothetical protein OQK82_08790, partial [Candidatus Pacearchaeota archaeon]|nr:hypothetical protein [Candidatus Pacearchaeota archaeon]
YFIEKDRNSYTMSQLNFAYLSFGYDTSMELLFIDFGYVLYPGWTGIVGPNGTEKRLFLI